MFRPSFSGPSEFDMVTQGPRYWPLPATLPHTWRLECSGTGKDESYESIAYNDAVRNIKRLIVEDRAACTRKFKEGRDDRWFFDDYQDKNGKWHSALAPPRSHLNWLKHDAVDLEPPMTWWSPELDEKAMRLAELLIVGARPGGYPPELMPDATAHILCGREGIKDKERSYRYMMIDKEIERARKMAELGGLERKSPKAKRQRQNAKAKANDNGDANAKCKATSKGKSNNLTEKAKPKAKGKAKVHSRTRRPKA